MKKAFKVSILILMGLLVKIDLYSQPYKSIFGTESSAWKIVASNLDVTTTDSVITSNDTIFNSLNYKKIYSYYPSGYMLRGFLREDTIRGKVWYYSLLDKTEKLIMDLSLRIGDSLKNKLWTDTGWVLVDSVYFKSNRKYIRLNTTVNQYGWGGYGEKLLYIEGIGTNRGIQYLEDKSLNISPYLLCFYKNGGSEYINNNPKFNGCNLTNADIKNIQSNKISRLLFPNPVTDVSNIRWENSKEKVFSQLIITDIFGRIVKSINVTGKNNIAIKRAEFSPGLYFAKFYSSDSKYYIIKFLIQ